MLSMVLRALEYCPTATATIGPQTCARTVVIENTFHVTTILVLLQSSKNFLSRKLMFH